MRFGRKRNVLKHYIITFLLIFIIPMSALLLYMTSSMHASAVNEQVEANNNTISLIYSIVQNDLDKLEPSALMALDNPSLRPSLLEQSFFNYYKAVNILKEIARSNNLIEMVIVYDRLNNIAVSNYGTTPIEYFGREVWKTQLENGMELTDYIESISEPAYTYGDVVITGLGTRKCVLYFYPSSVLQLADNAVIVFIMPVTNIPQMFSSQYNVDRSAFYLLDNENHRIVSFGDMQVPLLENALIQQDAGSVYKLDGNEYSVESIKNAKTGWTYLNILSLSKANEVMADKLRLFYLLFFCLLCLGGVGLYLSLKWNYYPILRLSNQVRPLANEQILDEEQTIRQALQTLQQRLEEAEKHIIDVQPAARGYMIQQATLGKTLDELVLMEFQDVNVAALREKRFAVAALPAKECQNPDTLKLKLGSKYPKAHVLCDMAQDMLLLVIETDQNNEDALRKDLNEVLKECNVTVASLGSLQRFDGLHRSFFEAELGLMLHVPMPGEARVINAHSIVVNAPPISKNFCANIFSILEDALLRSDAVSVAEFPDKLKSALGTAALSRVECTLLSYELFRVTVGAFSDDKVKSELLHKLTDYFYAIQPVLNKDTLADVAAFFCTSAFCCLHKNESDSKSQLRRILDYIDSHCTERDFAIRSVADEFGIMPSRLSRLFKEHMHVTVAEYVRHKRMAYAEALILEGRLSTNEISACLGYSNASSFIRFFRSELGMTPVQFKESKGHESYEKLPD